jgi:HD-like signal output (HDOD) protein
MSVGFESIVATVNTLPPLPESIRKIEVLFASEHPEVKELVRIIEADPILTAGILSKVNAPLYMLRNNIVSITQAITLFGMATIRAFAYQTTVSRHFDMDMSPYNMTNSQFGELCQMQSALMFQWYMGVDVELAKSLIPMAFLMETGRVIIANELAQSDYKNSFKEELPQCTSVEELERFYAGVTTAEVNAMLFEHWNFDPLFIESMRYLDSNEEIPARYVNTVEALRIVRTCINVKEGITEMSIAHAKAKVAAAGLIAERFEHAAMRIWRQHKERSEHE